VPRTQRSAHFAVRCVRGPSIRAKKKLGPGSAARHHSASKTRVNALMAPHRVRDTRPHHRAALPR